MAATFSQIDAELIAELSDVLESAWAKAQREDASAGRAALSPGFRSVAALRILEAAAEGERSIDRFHEIADAALIAR